MHLTETNPASAARQGRERHRLQTADNDMQAKKQALWTWDQCETILCSVVEVECRVSPTYRGTKDGGEAAVDDVTRMICPWMGIASPTHDSDGDCFG